MTEPRKKCRSHCRKCNLCFAGDTAFDMHITHEGEHVIHNDPASMTYDKGVHKGEARFDSEDGHCDKQAGCWHDGKLVQTVSSTIYATARSEAERYRLSGLKG